MTRDEIANNIDASWTAWIAALDGIPAERAEEPGACGYYSVKDLPGHIAFWDEQDLARAHKLARGEEVQPADWETLNDREFAQHKDDSLEQQTARMHNAHACLRTDVQSLESIDVLRLSETWEHYDAHREDILNWRKSQSL